MSLRCRDVDLFVLEYGCARITFSAHPGKQAGLQYVRLSTEVAGVQFAAPDAVGREVSKERAGPLDPPSALLWK
jgi:hypothetical protein